LSKSKVIGRFFILALLLAPLQGWSQENDVEDRIRKPVREAVDIRQETQKAQEHWREKRQELVDAHERLLLAQKDMEIRKESLQKVVTAARERVAAKEKQLADTEQISAQIRPFLEELIKRLNDQMNEGMPFLLGERQQRIQRLEIIMADPDVAVSEKFRKVMEALMVEAEYGITIEVYQETILVEGRSMLVNIFRLGRISLFYQSLDQQTCGFYNVASSSWQPIARSFNNVIQAAMDIGSKRKPVELLSLPLGRMEVP
jgi:hypothetical protein